MPRTVLHAFAALACLVAVARGAPAPRPHYGGTLRIETPGTLATLDPAAGLPDVESEAARDALLPLVFETLTRVGENGVQPLLADSWRNEADNRRWLFHLRPNVRLHDGTPLTAAQVVTSLGTANVSGWTAKEAGDLIIIECDRPLPDLPWQLAEMRRAIVVTGSGALPAGTGPFRLDRWDAGRRLVLAANEQYRDGRPFVDALHVEMGRSSRDAAIDVEAGRADLVSLAPQDVRGALQHGVRVERSGPRELVSLVFDTRRPSASQQRLRDAVRLAIDRPTIGAVLLQRQADAAETLLPDWLGGYASLFASRHDPARARSIVASLPAVRRSLALDYPAGDALVEAVADRVAVDLREAGLAIVLAPAARTGSAPPDGRLVRVLVDATSPDRALAAVVAALGVGSAGAPPDGSPVEAVATFEQSLLEPSVVVPLVHVRRIYGLGSRIRTSHGALLTPSGRPNLADAWLREEAP